MTNPNGDQIQRIVEIRQIKKDAAAAPLNIHRPKRLMAELYRVEIG
jgi:hypothetical protein